jgi:hypothetical protein
MSGTLAYGKTLAITLLVLSYAPASSAVIEVHKQAVFKVGTTGCSDWNIWTPVLDLYQYDKEAGRRLLNSSQRDCSHFSEGVTVFVEDYSLLRDSYCVRPPGATEACSWVLSSNKQRLHLRIHYPTCLVGRDLTAVNR